MQRRTRTRHLIELGGLVTKACLVELAHDDRATIFGALLELAGRVRDDADGGNILALWKRRGRRAFEAEAQAKKDAEEDAGAAASRFQRGTDDFG